MVNVITKEYLYTLQLHQVTYDKSDVVVKVFDIFSCPTIGSINLSVEVGSKCLDVIFSITPTSDQFRVKLGYPWLSSMKAIPYTIHECLKFPHNEKIICSINHSTYQPMVRCGDVNLNYFWSKQFQPLKPQSDVLFQSYEKWKNDMRSVDLFLFIMMDPISSLHLPFLLYMLRFCLLHISKGSVRHLLSFSLVDLLPFILI